MHAVIETSNLTKVYRGAPAVDHLSIAITAGTVHGLLGPNGSGKSTTMKMLLGLTRPTDGSVQLFGRQLTSATRPQLMRRIGALIEQPSGYPHLTGAENMRIIARLVGAQSVDVDRALHMVRLEKHADKLVKNYSLGMKQRLGIAMALARNPELVILDEPTNGLDPAGIEEIRSLMVNLAHQEGRTVLVSSHLLSEIEKTADNLTIIDRGKLIYNGTQERLRRTSQADVIVYTPLEHAAHLMSPRWRAQPGPGTLRFSNLSDDDVAQLCRDLVAADVPIHQVVRQRRSLEDIFMSITQAGSVQ